MDLLALKQKVVRLVAPVIVLCAFALFGCDGGDEDDFRAVTDTVLTNIQNQAFSFPNGAAFDASLAGQSATLTVGNTNAAGATVMSLVSSDGSALGGDDYRWGLLYPYHHVSSPCWGRASCGG